MKKVMMLLAIVALSITTLTGCNTTRGVGQDLQWTGEAIQDTVR
jgi:predicted small secreted protein